MTRQSESAFKDDVMRTLLSDTQTAAPVSRTPARPRLFHAVRWEIEDGWFSTKASFQCGSCNRYCDSLKVSRGKQGAQIHVVAQCKWCGEFNNFRKNGRALVYKD